MGKGEEEPLSIPITHSQSTPRNADDCSCCCRISGLFRFRCVFVLVLGLSVLLSAVFWLPPFFRHGDQGDLDLDYRYKGHDIVATFMVPKPLSLLEDELPQLGRDIFDELRVPTMQVAIISAESIAGSNTTKVTFSVDPDEHNSKIPSYPKSLVRDSFVSLVLRQSSLRLTESMFGEPSSFEVLKFVGGITVNPNQTTYPLQKVQIRFNFTLNFSIEQILDHFNELTSQLRSGLHLASYENLHVSLTNPKGSTVAPHTTVQSSVVLVVGTPSVARLKQLTQTIKGSPKKNLGLNNTQFGRVKQISLSSVNQHSLNGSSGGGTPAPSPAPLPHPHPPPHHTHHHHHHHRHHSDKQLPPAKPPSPNEQGGLKHFPASPPTCSPAPHKIHNAKPPDHHSPYKKKKKDSNKHPPLFPPVSQPVLAPHIPPPPPLQNLWPPPSPPLPPPLLPPPPPPPLTPPAPVPETIPASSPLPNVVFAHTPPPSKSKSDTDPPDTMPPGSFLQQSSCAGVHLTAIPTFLVVAALHLLQQK